VAAHGREDPDHQRGTCHAGQRHSDTPGGDAIDPAGLARTSGGAGDIQELGRALLAPRPRIAVVHRFRVGLAAPFGAAEGHELIA